jgi:hypothetical protein
MIRHIVLFKVSGSTRDANARIETLRSALEPLAASVPGVLSLRVSADPKRVETHWDAALETEHPSWDDLDAYQAHPEHLRALAVVNSVAVEKAVVDYETP